MARLNIEQDMGGLLFENTSGNANAPDYNGAIKVDGTLYDIAIWAKDFKNSSGFTVRISEPYEAVEEEEERPARRASARPARGASVKPRPKPSRR